MLLAIHNDRRLPFPTTCGACEKAPDQEHEEAQRQGDKGTDFDRVGHAFHLHSQGGGSRVDHGERCSVKQHVAPPMRPLRAYFAAPQALTPFDMVHTDPVSACALPHVAHVKAGLIILPCQVPSSV